MGLKKSAGVGAGLGRIEPREYPRDLDGLVAQLHDNDAGVRRWAARDLAEYPQAVPQLASRLLDEGDASVRSVLFSTLARLGSPAVVAALLPLLRSEHAALRNGAIEVLGGLPDEVAPHVDQLLRDGDADVRLFTVNLLGLLPHPAVPRWLAQVLRSEAEPNVVGAAIDVLAEVGGPEAAEPLRVAAGRFEGDPFIAFAAQLALQRIEAT